MPEKDTSKPKDSERSRKKKPAGETAAAEGAEAAPQETPPLVIQQLPYHCPLPPPPGPEQQG